MIAKYHIELAGQGFPLSPWDVSKEQRRECEMQRW